MAKKREKLKLTPYEVMTMLGATDPCLSDRLKAALDVEIEGSSEYEDMELPQQVALAMSRLARNKPESFDSNNKDDVVALRLAPLQFDENGNMIPSEKMMEMIEVDSMQVVQNSVTGGKAQVEIIAEDDDERLSSAAELTLKDENVEDSDTPVFHRYHSDPDNQTLEGKVLLLKEKVLDEKEFSVSFNYFMDHFAENEDFLKKGKKVTKAPRMKAALEQVAGMVFPGENIKVRHLVLTHLKRHDFLHGGGMVGDRQAVLFFFQDMGFGMVAICDLTGMTHYARLALTDKKK